MKSADPILGKHIVDFDLKWADRHDGSPSSGVFLMFDDGTYFEVSATQGYLEMGKHQPAQHHKKVDHRLANYYLAQSGSLSQSDEHVLPELLNH